MRSDAHRRRRSERLKAQRMRETSSATQALPRAELPRADRERRGGAGEGEVGVERSCSGGDAAHEGAVDVRPGRLRKCGEVKKTQGKGVLRGGHLGSNRKKLKTKAPLTQSGRVQ